MLRFCSAINKPQVNRFTIHKKCVSTFKIPFSVLFKDRKFKVLDPDTGKVLNLRYEELYKIDERIKMMTPHERQKRAEEFAIMHQPYIFHISDPSDSGSCDD